MSPLIVTAFFDVGRGSWSSLPRSTENYIESFRTYVALLPAPKYVVGPPALEPLVGEYVEYFDSIEFDAMPAAKRFLHRTHAVMATPHFRALFKPKDDAFHVEHLVPRYNIVNMMKWDALERAYTSTKGQFTHYVWLDFGLGRRNEPEAAYLPQPHAFAPIERKRIVVSAERRRALRFRDHAQLIQRVSTFVDQTAAGVMVVPRQLLRDFCALAHSNYERLLKLGIAGDDQVVMDMCVAEKPRLFYLSMHPSGLTKFQHVHNVIHGLDRRRPLFAIRQSIERLGQKFLGS